MSPGRILTCSESAAGNRKQRVPEAKHEAFKFYFLSLNRIAGLTPRGGSRGGTYTFGHGEFESAVETDGKP